jgi:hypothetical protein
VDHLAAFQFEITKGGQLKVLRYDHCRPASQAHKKTNDETDGILHGNLFSFLMIDHGQHPVGG